jgi:hypothetical protein
MADVDILLSIVSTADLDVHQSEPKVFRTKPVKRMNDKMVKSEFNIVLKLIQTMEQLGEHETVWFPEQKNTDYSRVIQALKDRGYRVSTGITTPEKRYTNNPFMKRLFINIDWTPDRWVCLDWIYNSSSHTVWKCYND